MATIDDMSGMIRCETGNELLIGPEPIETIAQEWLDAGFTCESAPAWWRAGCFLADSTAQLREAGMTPEQAEVDCPQFPGTSWGYAYCNCDVSIEAVRDAVAA